LNACLCVGLSLRFHLIQIAIVLLRHVAPYVTNVASCKQRRDLLSKLFR
jgi:hypothetical protein